MDWRSAYRDRLITPAESAGLVKSGDLVRLPLGSILASFTDALAARRDDLTGVVVQQATRMCAIPGRQTEAGKNLYGTLLIS